MTLSPTERALGWECYFSPYSHCAETPTGAWVVRVRTPSGYRTFSGAGLDATLAAARGTR